MIVKFGLLIMFLSSLKNLNPVLGLGVKLLVEGFFNPPSKLVRDVRDCSIRNSIRSDNSKTRNEQTRAKSIKHFIFLSLFLHYRVSELCDKEKLNSV